MMKMNRIAVLFMMVLTICHTAVSAQNADVQKAASRYKNVNTLTATVTRTKHNAAVVDDVVTKGNLYFKRPNKMCMVFEEGKDLLLMDGDVFTMVSGGKKSVAKGETYNEFVSLREVFVQIISGGDMNGNSGIQANIEVSQQGTLRILTVTPVTSKAKARMMFSSFILTIDTKSSEFKSLRMNERGRNYTQYDFSSYVFDGEVNENVFKL